jgi:hypothetical protein
MLALSVDRLEVFNPTQCQASQPLGALQSQMYTLFEGHLPLQALARHPCAAIYQLFATGNPGQMDLITYIVFDDIIS